MSKNVLIVDDDENIRELLAHALRRHRHAVFLASDGERMLQELERRRIDVIVTDVDMKPLNGLDALTKVRENPQYKNVKCVVLSGNDHEARARQLGADFFLKPVSTKMLLDAIES